MNKRVISVLLCTLILSGCAAKTQPEESAPTAGATLNDEARAEIRELLENSADRSVYADNNELQR